MEQIIGLTSLFVGEIIPGFFYCLGSFFVDNDYQMIDTMRYISTALLTVFISIAVAVFSDGVNNSSLSRYTFFNLVISIRKFFQGFFLVSFPLLFWDVFFERAERSVRFVLFVLWAYGIFLLFIRLKKIVFWLRDKRNRSKAELKYLGTISEHEELKEIFGEIWVREDIPSSDEIVYLGVFSEKIKTLFRNSSFENISQLLRSFSGSAGYRKLFSLYYAPNQNNRAFYEILLDWHFKVWQGEYSQMLLRPRNWDSGLYGNYSDLSDILSSLIQEITKRALLEKGSYRLFEILKGHINNHESDIVKGEDGSEYQYLETFPIYTTVFDNLAESPESFFLRSENSFFPPKWRITVENMTTNADHFQVRIAWFNAFFRWMDEKINSESKEDNRKLDATIHLLFPRVDSNWWSWILVFLVSSWTRDERMRSIIECGKRFGFSQSFAVASWGSDEEAVVKLNNEQKRRRKETVQLVVSFMGGYFSDIGRYLDELRTLESEYADWKTNSDHKKYEQRRRTLLEIFLSIKEKFDILESGKEIIT